MKRVCYFLAGFLVAFFSFNSLHAFPVKEITPPPVKLTQAQFADLSVKEFESLINQKLRLVDRLTFKIIRKKVRKNLRRNPEQTDRVMSIPQEGKKQMEGFSLFAFAFAGLGTALVLSWIGVGLFVALGGLVFGIVSLIRQKRNKGTYNVASKILAIFSVVIGGAALGLIASIFIAYS